jgi:GT2 family glycosyltransferase
MLNNDTEVLTANWIENLAGEAARSEIGAVGCKLYFPKDYNIEHKMTKSRVIQHAGVSLRILPDKVDAVNVFAGISVDDIDTRTKSIMYYYKRSSLAVTAACLAIRKSVFDEIGGFDKAFDVTYNDVDLCLRLVKAGYRNIYDPQTELIHHESISLGRPGDSGRDDSEYQQSVALLEQRWGKFIGHDPCFNTNLPRETHNFSIDFNAVTMVDV